MASRPVGWLALYNSTLYVPMYVTAMLLLLYSVCEMLFEDGTFFFSFSIKVHDLPLPGI